MLFSENADRPGNESSGGSLFPQVSADSNGSESHDVHDLLSACGV
jgi:hypothetical protein